MLFALLLGAALATTSQDSVAVRATLASERITAGASTVLVISVETDGATPAEIPVPVLPAGLELGPISDFSQLQVAFPGGRRRTTRREIVVLAREPGRYRIPSVTIDVAGRAYPTRPLELTVSGTAIGAGSAAGESAVQLRAWVVPDTVFVGEQILYRAEASFPEALRLRQTRAPVFDPPATTGFWVYDVPDPVTVGLRVTGDETFEVQRFRQVLFPLQPGDQVIPAAGMRYEFRAGSIFSPETRQLASSPIAVHVRPLPAGRPRDFQGAVGQYVLQVSLSATRTRAGDAVALRATLEGAGNIKALPRPQLPPLPGVDVHAGAEQVEVGFADDRVSGRKTFEWLLMPRAPGTLTVPGLRYAWFDPREARFTQASSAPLTLVVDPALPPDRPLAELAPPRSSRGAAPLRFVRQPWFLALQLLPLFALLFGAARLRRGRRSPARRAGAPEEALRALAADPDPRRCLEALGTLLQRERAGATPDGERALRALHERVREARYAPQPPDAETCARLVADAHALLGAERARRTRAPIVVLCLLLPAALHAQRPGAAPAAPGALSELAAEVRARPADPAAWYDMGHAFAARGQRGWATWAWLRTLQLEPRARDARHNLDVIGMRTARVALAPRLPLSSDELRLGAALLWWGAALLLLAGLRRRRLMLPGVALAGVAAVALLVVVLREQPASRAVALVPLVLRADPALRTDSVATVAPGTPLRLHERRAEWARVTDAEGREGWLEGRLIGRL